MSRFVSLVFMMSMGSGVSYVILGSYDADGISSDEFLPAGLFKKASA